MIPTKKNPQNLAFLEGRREKRGIAGNQAVREDTELGSCSKTATPVFFYPVHIQGRRPVHQYINRKQSCFMPFTWPNGSFNGFKWLKQQEEAALWVGDGLA